MTDVIKPKSDLKTRTLSAIVMVAISGLAIWLGGITFQIFVAAIGLTLIWEFSGLVRGFSKTLSGQILWVIFGLIYVSIACWTLMLLRSQDIFMALAPVVAVVATDSFAYFSGRSFGGPKIAPKISPSKTWSGLAGGMLGAALVALAAGMIFTNHIWNPLYLMLLAALSAIIAQMGDFFESWMKRRAGVKDSGKLIPGHGGLFDRLDGLLAVLFCVGAVMIPLELL